MRNNKGMRMSLFFSLGLVALVCLVQGIGGLAFVIIMVVIMCMLMNLYAGSKKEMKSAYERYKGYSYNPEKETVYYDSRLKTLRKDLVNGTIDDVKYKRQRDILMKEYNEGKQHE